MAQHQSENGTGESHQSLREQAERCRRLAKSIHDRETSRLLGEMASGLEKTADALSRRTA
jgi:hypothetical protein